MQADYKSLLAPCQATPAMAKAMGAYSEQITDPPEIVPAITRVWASVDAGRPTVLESITQDKGSSPSFSLSRTTYRNQLTLTPLISVRCKMPKTATGNWPRVQLSIHCRTCDDAFKFSIYYGESTIWNNSGGYRLAQWARHEEHDVAIDYEFYHGRKRKATQ